MESIESNNNDNNQQDHILVGLKGRIKQACFVYWSIEGWMLKRTIKKIEAVLEKYVHIADCILLRARITQIFTWLIQDLT